LLKGLDRITGLTGFEDLMEEVKAAYSVLRVLPSAFYLSFGYLEIL
jgi:hypothetical protein